MAYETRLYLEGEDSTDTQKMKSFMARPADHMSYGFSQRWKMLMRQTPEGLGAEEYSQWPWQPAETADDNNGSSGSDLETLVI